ncbi:MULTISPECIES: YopX family protein [unclassified Lysinibacillus]|uniref:YopX family protein n=1 Tax=unclassified Lysinibacillus TaxID=2636778 RepID=UPI00382C8D42
MREIKFRAWWSNIGEMEYFDTVAFLNFEDGTLIYQKHPEEETCTDEISDGFELMQYTGSKDANGVEIYEGDILQSVNDETYMSVVKYCTEGVGSCGCCYDEFEGTGFKAKDLRFKESVVVGNIYENPELLGGAVE